MQRMVCTWNTAMFFRTQHTTLHTQLQDIPSPNRGYCSNWRTNNVCNASPLDHNLELALAWALGPVVTTSNSLWQPDLAPDLLYITCLVFILTITPYWGYLLARGDTELYITQIDTSGKTWAHKSKVKDEKISSWSCIFLSVDLRTLAFPLPSPFSLSLYLPLTSGPSAQLDQWDHWITSPLN